jgi:hypothetical protein
VFIVLTIYTPLARRNQCRCRKESWIPLINARRDVAIPKNLSRLSSAGGIQSAFTTGPFCRQNYRHPRKTRRDKRSHQGPSATNNRLAPIHPSTSTGTRTIQRNLSQDSKFVDLAHPVKCKHKSLKRLPVFLVFNAIAKGSLKIQRVSYPITEGAVEFAIQVKFRQANYR